MLGINANILRNPAVFATQGRIIKAQLAEERVLLEAVKAQKLQELAAAGVPEKYAAALARLEPGKAARG